MQTIKCYFLQMERQAKDEEMQIDPGEAAQTMLTKFEKVMETVMGNQKEIKSELSYIRARLPASSVTGSFVSRDPLRSHTAPLSSMEA